MFAPAQQIRGDVILSTCDDVISNGLTKERLVVTRGVFLLWEEKCIKSGRWVCYLALPCLSWLNSAMPYHVFRFYLYPTCCEQCCDTGRMALRWPKIARGGPMMAHGPFMYVWLSFSLSVFIYLLCEQGDKDDGEDYEGYEFDVSLCMCVSV